MTIKSQAEILADTPPPPPAPRFSFMKYLSSKNKVSQGETDTQHTVCIIGKSLDFHDLDICRRKMFLTTLSFPPTARPPPPPAWQLWWTGPPRPLTTRTSLRWWRLKRNLQTRRSTFLLLLLLQRGSDFSDSEIKTTDFITFTVSEYLGHKYSFLVSIYLSVYVMLLYFFLFIFVNIS